MCEFVGKGWLSLVIPNASSADEDGLATGDNLPYAHRHSQTQPLSAIDALAQGLRWPSGVWCFLIGVCGHVDHVLVGLCQWRTFF